MKRLIDLLLLTIAAPFWAPLIGVIALAVRVQLGSPVYFRQRRPGLHGRIFEMVKFRTMTDARDAQGQLLPDAVRLTPFGRFLRASSLDELPELWNVLKGEMSLVGPRPLLVQYLDRYSERQARRHEVKPGITGLAQVQAIDMSTPKLLAKTDALMLKNMSVKVYFFYIYKTITGAGRGDRIKLH